MHVFVKYLILFAVPVLFVVLMRTTNYFVNKRALNKPPINKLSNEIRQPKVYFYAGVFCCPVAIIIILLAFFAPSTIDHILVRIIVASIFFFFGFLPMFFIMIMQINWKIEVGESSFVYTNLFGKKRNFEYKEVEVKLLSKCTRFYKNGKHIVGISFLQENWDCLQKAIQAYKKQEKQKIKGEIKT